MSGASDSLADKPRTWKPLAGAAAAAVVVLLIALSTIVFGDQLTAREEATIEACEAEYARTDGVPIVGGSIYVPGEMREYYGVVEAYGEVPMPLADVTPEVEEQWEAAAKLFVDTGNGTVVLVWRHEDESYTQCTVNATPAGIDANSAQVGPLVIE